MGCTCKFSWLVNEQTGLLKMMDDECDERIRMCADGEASNAPEV